MITLTNAFFTGDGTVKVEWSMWSDDRFRKYSDSQVSLKPEQAEELARQIMDAVKVVRACAIVGDK